MFQNGRFSSCGLTFLRIVTGIIFFMHGWQKVTVFGLAGVTGMFTSFGIPLPHIAAVVVTSVELIGGAALVLGLGTRWAALLNAIDMVVAICVVHFKNGFFNPNGVEHPLALVGALICLVLAGPGCIAMDNIIARKRMSA
ncbi:MAG TPA: DoxX family protein [Terriglobales bacterium]|jgi:putative oxidoreductase